MYEAIAFVISAMPMEQAAQSLREFSLDILALVHAVATKATPATKVELKTAIGRLLSLRPVCIVNLTYDRWSGKSRSDA